MIRIASVQVREIPARNRTCVSSLARLVTLDLSGVQLTHLVLPNSGGTVALRLPRTLQQLTATECAVTLCSLRNLTEVCEGLVKLKVAIEFPRYAVDVALLSGWTLPASTRELELTTRTPEGQCDIEVWTTHPVMMWAEGLARQCQGNACLEHGVMAREYFRRPTSTWSSTWSGGACTSRELVDWRYVSHLDCMGQSTSVHYDPVTGEQVRTHYWDSD